MYAGYLVEDHSQGICLRDDSIELVVFKKKYRNLGINKSGVKMCLPLPDLLFFLHICHMLY